MECGFTLKRVRDMIRTYSHHPLANADFSLLRRWKPSSHKSLITMLFLLVKINPFSQEINLKEVRNYNRQLYLFPPQK